MTLGGILSDVPQWVYDTSGSVCVVVSLVHLFEKRVTYWHWSNASLIPYFLLFAGTRQYMLAGLQVSYLIFGIHGWWLWKLEARRDRHGTRFAEGFWYNLGWVLTLAIFAYTAAITELVGVWAWLQFAITSLALIANWGTTRKWRWSWFVWMAVNVASAIYFARQGFWAQFALQFVLFAMSVQGARAWRRKSSTSTSPHAVVI